MPEQVILAVPTPARKWSVLLHQHRILGLRVHLNPSAGADPAPQYGLDRQPSRPPGAKKTSQTSHGRGRQPERAGESCLDSTAGFSLPHFESW